MKINTGALVVFVGLLLAAAPAFAQSADSGSRAAYEAAFQETLNKPSDPPTLVRFAELAIQAGDLHGAISALERLLLLDPAQPRINLELAALYFRLEAYATAQVYLAAVIASPRATAANREQANVLLAQIDNRAAKSKFSGEFLFGLQYSSNANSGVNGTIQSGGTPVVPTPNVSGTPDWAAISGGVLHHRYELQARDHSAIESDLAVYATRQFKASTANVLLVDLTSGPRFDLLADSVDGLTARPFATGRYVSLHDQPTYWSYGTGIELAKEIGAVTRGTLTVVDRRRDFQNNADVPNNDDSSGNEMYGVLGLQSQLTPWLTLQLGANVARFVASIASESYREYGGGVSAVFEFTDPVGLNGRQWSVTLGGRVLFDNYDAPDPTVDPSVVRTQRDLVGSFVAAVPLDERLTLIAQASYTDRAASLNNYAYTAATGMLGVGWRF